MDSRRRLLLWLRSRRPSAHSEVRAMINQAAALQHQLEDTKTGLADFIARAERVAQIMDPQGSNVDEI